MKDFNLVCFITLLGTIFFFWALILLFLCLGFSSASGKYALMSASDPRTRCVRPISCADRTWLAKNIGRFQVKILRWPHAQWDGGGHSDVPAVRGHS